MELEAKLNRIGFWASACCAIHCALTPILLLAFPILFKLPEHWHDFFLRGSAIFAWTLMAWKACKLRKLWYLPMGLSILATFFAFGEDLAPHQIHLLLDISVGALLIAAHTLNHKVRYCRSHSH